MKKDKWKKFNILKPIRHNISTMIFMSKIFMIIIKRLQTKNKALKERVKELEDQLWPNKNKSVWEEK